VLYFYVYGTLWVNTTLTTARPVTVAGDLAIAPAVTSPSSPALCWSGDIMQASDTGRAELQVNGTLVADGTPAQQVTLAGATASPGSWYGVELNGAAASTLDNVTVVGNSCGNVGAGVDNDFDGGPSLEIANSILADNFMVRPFGGAFPEDCLGDVTTRGYNLIEKVACLGRTGRRDRPAGIGSGTRAARGQRRADPDPCPSAAALR
jgi:hypothetical protein